ncbi:MAG: NUDIX domain-containing protein, partial [Bacteroidales bacterium]|nr:NUDIX domain-containing protein [Bacteroidales bacterium]
MIHVPAAGGLVQNEKGEYLFIFRNNHLDLPKGHKEEGENLEVTAVREVEEETPTNPVEPENPGDNTGNEEETP